MANCIYTYTVRVSVDSKIHCTSWDCPRMANCIYTYCQSIRGFPRYIVHPGTVRGWPTAYIPTVRVSIDSQDTLYIPGLSEDGQLHIYLYCQSIRGFPRYIVHPGTVRGWPTAYIPTVRVSADSQDTLYIPGLSEDDQLHIYLLSEYP